MHLNITLPEGQFSRYFEDLRTTPEGLRSLDRNNPVLNRQF